MDTEEMTTTTDGEPMTEQDVEVQAEAETTEGGEAVATAEPKNPVLSAELEVTKEQQIELRSYARSRELTIRQVLSEVLVTAWAPLWATICETKAARDAARRERMLEQLAEARKANVKAIPEGVDAQAAELARLEAAEERERVNAVIRAERVAALRASLAGGTPVVQEVSEEAGLDLSQVSEVTVQDGDGGEVAEAEAPVTPTPLGMVYTEGSGIKSAQELAANAAARTAERNARRSRGREVTTG